MLVDYHCGSSRTERDNNYYDWQLPNLGLDFLDELESALSLAAENPHLGAVYHRSFRRVLLKRFPFAVFYLYSRDGGRPPTPYAGLLEQEAIKSW